MKNKITPNPYGTDEEFDAYMQENDDKAFNVIMIMFVLILVVTVFGCAPVNKIAVQTNKYGPVHLVKYQEKNGKIYVRGREVRLIPGTKVYAGN